MSTMTPAIAESRLINRLALRLMPLLGLLYLVAYIDRSNISFAKLQMLGSLGLSEVAYGLGASLFFIGYLIFEVPSNVMLHKYGAPRWMARIMLTWGVVTILLAFTQNATMFYVLRFLLGASEAGLYPGVIYYLTLWFPARHRVRMLGYFTVGSSLRQYGRGADLRLAAGQGRARGAGRLATRVHRHRTAVGAVDRGGAVLLPSSPKEAKFLSADEKQWLTNTLDAERAQIRASVATHGSLLSVLTEPRVIGMALYYMMLSISVYGVSYWLPTLVKGFGVSNTTNGLLNIIPWLMATIVPRMVAFETARHRQSRARRNAGFRHCSGVMCFAAAVFLPTNTLRFSPRCVSARRACIC